MCDEGTDTDSFDDDWLALREPADARARDATLLLRLRDALGRGASAEADDATPTLRVVDLGAGTGANLRYLAPRLGRGQCWTLVDHDARLLERLEARLASWAASHGARIGRDGDALRVDAEAFDARVERCVLDLARDLDALSLTGTDLVTASALIDLAGGDWLDALAERAAAAGSAVLVAMSVDGRLALAPAHEGDAAIVRAFGRHQGQDKGLGIALGAAAPDRLATSLETRGYDVRSVASDWRLDAADAAEAALQREFLAGLARAATEIEPALAERAARWLAARRAQLDAGGLTLRVGHRDLLGLPPGRAAAKTQQGPQAQSRSRRAKSQSTSSPRR